MTYACPIWEVAAYSHLLKLLHLQNKALHTTGNFPRHTPVCDLHKAFKLPYLYDYITKLCRQQAEVMQNYENFHNNGQGKPRHRKFKFGSGQVYDHSSDWIGVAEATKDRA
jgi:hypothetical protein